MGLFNRLRAALGGGDRETAVRSAAAAPIPETHLHGGDESLEIVGEAGYQDALWAICGAPKGHRVQHEIVAVLIPESDNPYDPNAIAVQIDGCTIGYFGRDNAAKYRPGLLDLMKRSGGNVALNGVIIGGGHYADGPGRLGVWLHHDPAEFRVTASRVDSTHSEGQRATSESSMRTGLTEAWSTDADDDTYDLSWINDIPDSDESAIAKLRELLAKELEPIDRHFQFAELETRLYRFRDVYDSALDEFDEVCRLHDAEMDVICEAFVVKWGKIPLLETYRQMAIRQQKKQDWDAVLWWVNRGLHLYGNRAVRVDAVADLENRRVRALAKVGANSTEKGSKRRSEDSEASHTVVDPTVTIEVLLCSDCGVSFERVRVRGRKPQLCPTCRSGQHSAEGKHRHSG